MKANHHLIIIIILILAPLFAIVKGQECLSAVIFEKTTGAEPITRSQADFEVIYQATPGVTNALTNPCGKTCQRQLDCIAYTVNYTAGICFGYKRRISANFRIKKAPGVNLFQKICLTGVLKQTWERVCPSQPYWTFEKVPKHTLDVVYNRTAFNIQTREECMAMCIKTQVNNEPVCRSATYSESARTCAMSTETRFTSPKEFRAQETTDYLENQCSSRPPASSCSYETMQKKGVVSIDNLQGAQSIEACQSTCDSLQDFVCRSFEFRRTSNDRLSQECLLSGDNSLTLDGATLPDKFNSVYRERKCVTEKCINGIYTYEKMTRTTLTTGLSQRQFFIPANVTKKTAYCLQACDVDGGKCPSVLVNYNDRTCRILDRNSQGRENYFAPFESVNFFEKICLRGAEARINCRANLWAFERLLGHQLTLSLYYQRIPGVQSRRDCEELCINSRECRSALYEADSTDCRLSAETRRTRPNDFKRVFVGQIREKAINYLENTCVPAPTSCTYRKYDDSQLVYSDVEADGYPSDSDCRQLCDSTRSFTCRGYTYFSLYRRCFLSADDGISTENRQKLQKFGLTYHERSCQSSTVTTTSPPDGDCLNGLVAYEKITGSELRSATVVRQFRVPSFENEKSEYCLKQCNAAAGSECKSVHFKYGTFNCQILGTRTEDVGNSNLLPKPETNYFQKVCLRGATARSRCFGKAWAFERSVGTELTAELYYRTERFKTKQQCQEMCLEESACRSVVFDENANQCKLSAHTRRSKPNNVVTARGSQVNYLENMCVPAPTKCSYSNKFQNSQTSFPDVVIQNTVSESNCRGECERKSSFVCRSYSFEATRRMCMLSGDDTTSAGNDAKKSQFGITYIERTCDESVDVSTTTSTTPTTSCGLGETALLAKTLGYQTRRSQQLELYSQVGNRPGIVEECKTRCRSSVSCKAFVVNYNEPQRCYATAKATDPTELIEIRLTGYFEDVCIPTVNVPSNCRDKLWALDRFPFKELRNIKIQDSFQGLSREQCEAKCLSSKTVTCRSILYNRRDRTCKISEQNRQSTNNYRLFRNDNVEYIENTCLTERYKCWYNPQQLDSYLAYATKSLPRKTYRECETECDRQRTFYCRSFSYVDDFSGGTCVLNGEDVKTAGAFAKRYRRDSRYVDKRCDSTGPVTTTTGLPPPSKCKSGQLSFEKITAVDVRRPHGEMNAILDTDNIAKSCADECVRMSDRCDAFVLDYISKKCYAILKDPNQNPNFDSNYFQAKYHVTYFEKVCLPEKCGNRWTFDRVLRFQLSDAVGKELNKVGSRVECQRACLRETAFKCLSANYYFNRRLCQLNTETKKTQPSGFSEQLSSDYMENLCVDEPATCKYESQNGKYLPYPDKVVTSSDEERCKMSCQTDPVLPCRSYSWDKTTQKCFLNGDDTWSRPRGLSALLTGFNYISYAYGERGRCEQVKVTCNEVAMSVSLTFSKPFKGRIYAKSKPQDCYVTGSGENEMQLVLSLGSKCGTKAETRTRYVNDIVVQKHPVIQTSSDKHVKIVCTFDRPEQTLQYGGLGRDGDYQVTTRLVPAVTETVTNSVPPPPLRMKILDQNGRESQVVGIGDPLTVRIEFENPRASLGIFVKNLTAETVHGEYLILIDINGCPVDSSVFPALQHDPRDGKSLFANFKAFRFPSSGYITWTCRVTFCPDRCKPVRCPNNGDSVGRRRRDVVGGDSVGPTIAESGFRSPPEANINATSSGNSNGTNGGVTVSPLNEDVPVEAHTMKTESSGVPSSPETSSGIRSTSTARVPEEVITSQVPLPTETSTGIRSTSTARVPEEVITSQVPLPMETSPGIKLTSTDRVPEEVTSHVPLSAETSRGISLTSKIPSSTARVPEEVTLQDPSSSETSPGIRSTAPTRKEVVTSQTPSSSETSPGIRLTSARLPNNGNVNRPTQRHLDTPDDVKVRLSPEYLPNETPLRYSLLVSPDKQDYIDEDKAMGAADSGVAPKRDYHETYSVYEKDLICSSRSTVIASIVTIVLVHLMVFVAGFCYYRYQKRRKKKHLGYPYVSGPPLPPRNNQSSNNGVILGRPNMTFRSIYGYISPPNLGDDNKTENNCS
ncbi:Uncharacterised protein g5409 [Pycnogonum litorale]